MRSLEHNWNSNKLSFLRGVAGMEVQVPKPAVGMTPKDFVITLVFSCLEFSTIQVYLWATGGKMGRKLIS